MSFQAIAHYEQSADYYKGEESNRQVLFFLFFNRQVLFFLKLVNGFYYV
jgi:hypothetical protein